MSFSVTMPALGESVSEGTVTRWLKNEGDMVAVDEPLLEVSTDKVDTEIPSPVAGVLSKIVVGVDQTVAVGAELAIISTDASAAAPVAPAAPAAPAPVVETPVAQAPAPTPPPVAAPAAPAATSGGTVITMPALGESVSEGTVTRWLKNVGDSIAVDEALLEVSTDKVDTEIPSPVAGTLLAIDVPVDTTVAVGARLGLIGVSGAVAPAAPAAPVAPVASEPIAPVQVAQVPAQVSTPVAVPVTQAPVSQPQDAYVTPIVRKLANELGINLANVRGTGIGGRIRKEDLQALAPQSAPTPVANIAAAPASTAPRPAAPVASPLRGTTVTCPDFAKLSQRVWSSLYRFLLSSQQLSK